MLALLRMVQHTFHIVRVLVQLCCLRVDGSLYPRGGWTCRLNTQDLHLNMQDLFWPIRLAERYNPMAHEPEEQASIKRWYIPHFWGRRRH